MNDKKLDRDTLITLLEEITRSKGGHWTLLRFSTEWKCLLGTPNIHPGGNETTYGFLSKTKGFPTMEEALAHAVVGRRTFN